MKIEIPDEMAKEIGIDELTEEEITLEITQLAWRAPTSVTGEKHPQGIMIYVKDS